MYVTAQITLSKKNEDGTIENVFMYLEVATDSDNEVSVTQRQLIDHLKEEVKFLDPRFNVDVVSIHIEQNEGSDAETELNEVVENIPLSDIGTASE